MSEEKFWKIISSKKGFEGDWIHINLDKIELPDKTGILFEAIHYCRNGVGVVAENKNHEIMLVKNYRYISDIYSWEVPAGTIPPGKNPEETIIEELKEEAGCIVSASQLKYLGNHYASIGSSDQIFYCFHATDVEQTISELDKNEILDARWFTKSEIKKMIEDGEIKDGFTLVLLLRYLLLLT